MASYSENHSMFGARNVATKATSSSASAAPSGAAFFRHVRMKSEGSSASVRPSAPATTFWIATRRLKLHVRAPKKPARCAASCTESENVSSFLSSLNVDVKS